MAKKLASSRGTGTALSHKHGKYGLQNRGCTGCFLLVFGLMFGGLGSIFLYLVTIKPLSGVMSARSWVETPCVILSSQVQSHEGDDGATYSIEIRYSYIYNGQQYKGDRYHFFDGNTGGWRGKETVVRRYPPGSETVCYVNPRAPHKSVINRGFTADMWWGLFPIPFVAIGVGALFFAIRTLVGGGSEAARRLGPDARIDRLQRSGGQRDVSVERGPQAWRDASLVSGYGDDGPIVLESTSTPLGQFGCLLGFACFWNGIVSVFLWHLIGDLQRGNVRWFLLLFLTPFVLVGLGLIVGVLYSFLALFNPRPTLKLSRGRVPLGESATLEWSFWGRSSAIRKLTLSLVGQETAKYTRGTDTHTDKSIFFRQTLFETDNPTQFLQGRAELAIPSHLMHSFEGGNNRIVWLLKVDGQISFWPDVSAEFPLEVSPHERSGH